MDWKLERQRREKQQAMDNKASAEGACIVGEMEREFELIFGAKKRADFAPSATKSGAAALGAARSSRHVNVHKHD